MPTLPKNVGNYPVNEYQIETSDPDTGESIFRRISNAMRYLTKSGQEIPDPRPAAPALGRKPETNIRDYIKTLVHNERLQQELDAQGAETFEEANDFEVGDDYFPDSEYENDLEPSVAELIRAGTASLSAKARNEEISKARKATERSSEADAEIDDTSSSKPKKSPRRASKALLDPEEGAGSEADRDAGD